MVNYDTPDSGIVDAFQKRALGPKYRISEQFYSNGTKRIARRSLSEQEVRQLPPVVIYFESLTSAHSALIYGSVL